MGIKLVEAKELEVRTKLALDIASISLVGFVVPEAIRFSSKEHFSAYNGLTNQLADTFQEKSDKLKASLVKYALIYLSNITISKIVGAKKCPDMFLEYVIELFQENDDKNDDYSSHNNFIKTTIELINKFLYNTAMGTVDNATRTEIIPVTKIQPEIVSERVPNVIGHSQKYIINVEIK